MDFKKSSLDEIAMNFISDRTYNNLYGDMDKLKEMYQNGDPFPFLVFDNLIDDSLLTSVAAQFPEPCDAWWKYDNVLERKFARDDIRKLPTIIRNFIHELMEKEFVTFLERMTGIEGLIVDHHLNGGGLHQHARGGKLDIHADYNYHPKTYLDRRINVLIYLNENWKPEWKGNLEFWDKHMTNPVASIVPLFNRMVIFNTTDDSLHGLPDPLECPDGVTRKSIALYYYTNGRPENERSRPHSTLYRRRPDDPIDSATEELRLKRAIRRV
jgi:hypothetical protein